MAKPVNSGSSSARVGAENGELKEDCVLFSFGAIADIQYADDDDAWDFKKTRQRRYRHALDSVAAAARVWREEQVKFVLQLGDVIDGRCAKLGQSNTDLQAVLNAFNCTEPVSSSLSLSPSPPPPPPPVFHTIGNHELYNFSREELEQLLQIPQRGYYSVTPVEGWRIVVLDPYDVSILGHDEHKANFQTGLQLLQQHNPNDVFGQVDYTAGLEELDKRWVPYNGAVGHDQLTWLQSELVGAQQQQQRVLVVSHVPLFPHSADDSTILWNYSEVVQVLQEKAGVVVAVFSGHDHKGGYQQDNFGIHYLTMPSPLECEPDALAFATVDVCSDKLVYRGSNPPVRSSTNSSSSAKPPWTNIIQTAALPFPTPLATETS